MQNGSEAILNWDSTPLVDQSCACQPLSSLAQSWHHVVLAGGRNVGSTWLELTLAHHWYQWLVQRHMLSGRLATLDQRIYNGRVNVGPPFTFATCEITLALLKVLNVSQGCSFLLPRQCDIHSSGLGASCQTHAWNSCEHIDQMTREILVENIKSVRSKHPGWSAEQQLQGMYTCAHVLIVDSTW